MNNKKNCEHFIDIDEINITPKTSGSEECEKEGTKWAGLRLCMTCGRAENNGWAFEVNSLWH